MFACRFVAIITKARFRQVAGSAGVLLCKDSPCEASLLL